MAEFKISLAKTLSFEGVYSNDLADRGGETYCGISRISFPHWEGWGVIDSQKKLFGVQSLRNGIPQVNLFVEALYRDQFWGPCLCDKLLSQTVANIYFDMAVNLGIKRATEILQRALAMSGSPSLLIDGKIGPTTLDAANRLVSTGATNRSDFNLIMNIGPWRLDAELKLVLNLVKERVKFYAGLAPSNSRFVKGWINRAYDLLPEDKNA